MSEPAIIRSQQGEIGVLTVNNPPVNALAAAVRSGIEDGVKAFGADPSIKAIVLIGGGRTFIAGADIREFGKPPSGPNLNAVISGMEDCPKPIVAALHGTALGGGLETALGAHYRCAVASARVGLPEVHLGLLPGAGGTQRLPRLAGATYALEAMVSRPPHPGQGSAVEGHRRQGRRWRSARGRGGLRPRMLVAAECAAPAGARPHGRARQPDRDRGLHEKSIARQGARLQGAVEHRQDACRPPSICHSIRACSASASCFRSC